MSFQQIAKLYLRGSLCNNTLKNLTKDELEFVEQHTIDIVDDPNLQHVQRAFCNALAGTIGNEYADRDIGKQDYSIAVVRAVVAAYKGYGQNPACPHIFGDPKQKAKWVKTWIFQYLRQLLRENKIPQIKRKEISVEIIEDAAFERIIKEISQYTKEFSPDISATNRTIKMNTFLLPSECLRMILEFKEMYLRAGVLIEISNNGISIKRTGDPDFEEVNRIVDRSVREYSFDADEESSDKDSLEARASARCGGRPVELETINRIRSRVPDHVRPVLDIYTEDTRPEKFIEQYGDGKPKIAHVAAFLEMSPREVKRFIGQIKIHTRVVMLGY